MDNPPLYHCFQKIVRKCCGSSGLTLPTNAQEREDLWGAMTHHTIALASSTVCQQSYQTIRVQYLTTSIYQLARASIIRGGNEALENKPRRQLLRLDSLPNDSSKPCPVRGDQRFLLECSQKSLSISRHCQPLT